MLRKSGLLALERTGVSLGRELWVSQRVGKVLPEITHFYILTPFSVHVRPTDHQKEC